MKKNQLEEIINFVNENYESFETPIETQKRWEFNKNEIFSKYNGKNITDFYCLDINIEEGKKIINTNWQDKLKYKLSKNKDKRLNQLNKKYLKEFEDSLPALVSNEKIIEIDKRTKLILNQIDKISKNNSLNNDYKEDNDRDFKKDRENNNERKKETPFNIKIGNKKETHQPNHLLIAVDDRASNYCEEYAHNLTHYFPDVKSIVMPNLSTILIESEINNIRKIKENIENGKFKIKNLNLLNFSPFIYIEESLPRTIPELGMNLKYDGFNDLWNLQMIEAYQAQKTNKGKGIKIGVLDTGVEFTHSEIASCFDKENLGFDFVYGKDPTDAYGHGTHVAGIISGIKTGIATEARLYSLKVLSDEGYGSTENVIKAIEWSIEHNLDLINLSLGGAPPSKIEQLAFTKAKERGIISVAAAGNSGNVEYHFPASYKDVISVASLDKNKKRSYFSTKNDMLDISAPGSSIFSAYLNNTYSTLSGTSMATPHVAGALAIAKSFSNYEANKLEDIMKNNSEKLGDQIEYGHGLILTNKILEALK